MSDGWPGVKPGRPRAPRNRREKPVNEVQLKCCSRVWRAAAVIIGCSGAAVVGMVVRGQNLGDAVAVGLFLALASSTLFGFFVGAWQLGRSLRKKPPGKAEGRVNHRSVERNPR